MGFKTSYKPTTLRDMIPYLQNIKQCGEETVVLAPGYNDHFLPDKLNQF